MTERASTPCKASDLVAEYLSSLGITHVFGVTGGASIHLIHSIDSLPELEFICVHHEQAGAMAADAYARTSGRIGAALATSGPGATNLITGIASAWYDSVPVLYLTGQVARFRMRGDLPVRQTGFQETPIIDMVGPITKYVGQVMDPDDLLFELEKAVWFATHGRPGPVLVDVPDDIQRMMITRGSQRHFDPSAAPTGAATAGYLSGGAESSHPPGAAKAAQRTIELLEQAERPVLILGSGVRTAGAIEPALQLAQRLQLPVCPTWGALDFVPHDSSLFAGTIGTHGSRAGNFTMQNSDLVISIGARLGFKETGTPLTDWARGARTVVIDIDAGELSKFTNFQRPLDVAAAVDAGDFIEQMLSQATGPQEELSAARKRWQDRVSRWKQQYSVRPERGAAPDAPVDPYELLRVLSHEVDDRAILAVDTGCTVAWTTQAFEFSGHQRFLHAFNNTPMGYALPAALGAALAAPDRRVVCLVGDGSLMMNLQELATLIRQELPILVILLNNSGYGMVQQTQDEWLGSQYVATSIGGGLGFPEYETLAASFGFGFARIKDAGDVEPTLTKLLAGEQAMFCEVVVPSSARVIPQCKFGRPVEDAEPLLPRAEFLSNMIVPALPVSAGDQ